jgi:hypothetical protein
MFEFKFCVFKFCVLKSNEPCKVRLIKPYFLIFKRAHSAIPRCLSMFKSKCPLHKTSGHIAYIVRLEGVEVKASLTQNFREHCFNTVRKDFVQIKVSFTQNFRAHLKINQEISEK